MSKFKTEKTQMSPPLTLIQPLECYLLLYENHELVYVVVLPPNVVLALKASV